MVDSVSTRKTWRGAEGLTDPVFKPSMIFRTLQQMAIRELGCFIVNGVCVQIPQLFFCLFLSLNSLCGAYDFTQLSSIDVCPCGSTLTSVEYWNNEVRRLRGHSVQLCHLGVQ